MSMRMLAILALAATFAATPALGGSITPNCDDGNACTNDTFFSGIGCVSLPVFCSDNNLCTRDDCEPATGCTYAPIDAAIECDDGDECTHDSCDAAQGCTSTPAAVSIRTTTNGQEPSDANAAEVPNVAAGAPIEWRYLVENSGPVAVPSADLTVTDDQPGVTPAFLGVLTGDADNVLEPGEVWIYRALGTALDLTSPPSNVNVEADACTHAGTEPTRTAYVNTGTATTACGLDSAQSSYCNPAGCGDGVVGAGEECDGGACCQADCTLVTGASLAAINCRIAALIDDVVAAPDIGDRVEARLVRRLQRAKEQKERAEALIAAGKPAAAERHLRKAARRLISFEWSVRSLSGRRDIEPATAAELRATSEALRADLVAAADAL